jgi:hypothetical protein
MRLSTATTPRVIACAEDLPLHVALPQGCLGALETLLREHGVALELQDERTSGLEIPLVFQGSLTGAPSRAAKALLAHDAGILVAPPGAGLIVLRGGMNAVERRRMTERLAAIRDSEERLVLASWIPAHPACDLVGIAVHIQS